MPCKSKWIFGGVVLAALIIGAAPAPVAPKPAADANSTAPAAEVKPEDQILQLRKDARSGNADSAFSLAYAYLFGAPGLPVNPALGVYWLRRAADGGNLDARYNLGICLLKGWGVPQDRPAAWVQLQQAAASGHPAAAAACERMRADGVEAGRVDGAVIHAIPPNLPKAVEELLKMARSGNLYARGVLVRLKLEHPDKLAPHTPELLQLLTPHEHSNRPELLCALGLLLRERSEAARAAACFERAVKEGHAESAVYLGEAYERGDGVPFDPKKAAELFRIGAQQELPLGEYHYAMTLLSGSGGKEDLMLALDYLKKASDHGVPEAVYQLGLLAEKGIGGDADTEKAFFFYDRAMQLGSAEGAVACGRCHRDGIGTPADPLKAALAWKKAADRGSAEGRRLYALALLNGFGLPRDRRNGLLELQRAAAAGDREAQRILQQ